MNTRLLSYLRSIGLADDASKEDAWKFMQGLRGLKSSIANALNYEENDAQARTNADLVLRALGVNPENPTEDAEPPARSEESQRSQPNSDGASTAGDVEAARAAGQAEAQARLTQIRELGELSGASAETIAKLQDDTSLSMDSIRTQLLEDHRARTRSVVSPDMGAPAVHQRSSVTGHSHESLAAALMMRAGVADPTQQWCKVRGNGTPYFQSDLEDDTKRAIDLGNDIRDYSLVEICRQALALEGITARPSPAGIVEASRGLASTGEFVGIITQTFGAIMLQAFQDYPDTTGPWTVERDNPNFMENERTRLKKGGALTLHGRGSTADHMDHADITEKTKVNRYTGQFVVDEIDLQNDYFGALAGQTPQEIGMAARRIRPDLVYSILMGNPNLASGTPVFDASHNNLHPTNALDIAGLQAALSAMALQQEDGVNLNMAGRYLIVPPTLRFTARELIGSAIVVMAGGSNTTTRPNVNALNAEDLSVISEARLENGVTDPATGTVHAGSSSTWFLTATAAANHTVEVTYLAGSARAPAMRSFVLDRGQWGIGWDVRHDIGAVPLAYQGMSKSTA